MDQRLEGVADPHGESSRVGTSTRARSRLDSRLVPSPRRVIVGRPKAEDLLEPVRPRPRTSRRRAHRGWSRPGSGRARRCRRGPVARRAAWAGRGRRSRCRPSPPRDLPWPSTRMPSSCRPRRAAPRAPRRSPRAQAWVVTLVAIATDRVGDALVALAVTTAVVTVETPRSIVPVEAAGTSRHARKRGRSLPRSSRSKRRGSPPPRSSRSSRAGRSSRSNRAGRSSRSKRRGRSSRSKARGRSSRWKRGQVTAPVVSVEATRPVITLETRRTVFTVVATGTIVTLERRGRSSRWNRVGRSSRWNRGRSPLRSSRFESAGALITPSSQRGRSSRSTRAGRSSRSNRRGRSG